MKIFFILLCAVNVFALDSITESSSSYREICQKAATDDSIFQIFRSLPGYAKIVEERGEKKFGKYLLKEASPEILGKIKTFQTLDQIGSPFTKKLTGLGQFSGTTLRYIAIADQIKKLFTLPKSIRVTEVGAGFGGQCYVLSQIQPISNYFIYDLPEACALIQKAMKTLAVNHVTCCNPEEPLSAQTIDLFISNYAFSECSRKMQMNYFEKLIKKSDRGYVLYNQISRPFGVDSLSPREFVTLLRENGMNPKIMPEFVMTNPDNVLIIWDKTAS